MNEIDTSTFEFDFDNLFKVLSDSSMDKSTEAKNFFKHINDSFKNIDFITVLTNNGNGTVQVVMKTKSKKDTEQPQMDTTDFPTADMAKIMQSMTNEAMLRGSIYETGGIHSFWVKSSQKNLIAMLFELPEKPVKVGDSWELDVNLIANDQNFECDSAYKVNKVTFTDLKKINGETIATLQYKVVEFVDGTLHIPAVFRQEKKTTKSMMKFDFQGIAEFSLDKGRWVSYDAILSLEASGIMTANTKKKFSLIEE